MSKYLNKLKEIREDKANKLLIIGLGVENRQFLKWVLVELNFPPKQIILADKVKVEFDFANVNDFETYFGHDYLDSLQQQNVKMVIKSPGLWSLNSELVAFRKAHEQNIILSSLTFFLEKYREQIVGVTGTKGKTTTCSLIYHLLKDDQEIYYCGNTTGISPYKYWNNESAYFIIELSSFQLQDLSFAKLSPKFSVITNLFVDHLDQHGTKEEYWKAKDAIFEFQTLDDYFVAHDQIWDNLWEREMDAETNFGLIKYTSQYPNDQFMLTKVLLDGVKSNFKTKLLGEHNLQNLSLALVICSLVLLSKTLKDRKPNLALALEKLIKNQNIYQQRLDQFQAIAGRLELVKTLMRNGITLNIYNDNAATEPDATIAAIRALTQKTDQKLYLIAGGKLKQGNFLDLANLIRQKITSKAIFKYTFFSQVGYELDRIDKENGNIGFEVFPKMREFFTQGLDIDVFTSKDDQIKVINILFSPGGSSFDEFTNYLERQKIYLEWLESF